MSAILGYLKCLFCLLVTIYKWWFIVSMSFFVLLVVLSKVTHPHSAFTYKIKFILVYYSCIMGTALLIPIFALRPASVANTRICGYVVRKVAYLMDMTYELRGSDIMQQDSGAVIIANHQSSLDIFAMINLFEVIPNYTGVAKREILFAFPFGPAAWLGGIVFINRQNKKAAYSTLAHCKKLMIDDKVKIMMYPEGTRNQNGGFLPFKKGAFNMAIETQAPIIPLVISPYYFIDGKKKIFDKGHMIMQALEPISTVGMTLADSERLTDMTRELMLKEYQKITAECITNFASPEWKNMKRPRMTTISSQKSK